jgi:hypothetical protein
MAIVNITCWNDVDFIRGFVFYQISQDGSAGAPFDLTGNMLRMGIRFNAVDVIEEMELTTENGGIAITDPANGKFTITIMQDQLVRMPLGNYEHSLIRISGVNKFRIWSGSLTLNPGASR